MAGVVSRHGRCMHGRPCRDVAPASFLLFWFDRLFLLALGVVRRDVQCLVPSSPSPNTEDAHTGPRNTYRVFPPVQGEALVSLYYLIYSMTLDPRDGKFYKSRWMPPSSRCHHDTHPNDIITAIPQGDRQSLSPFRPARLLSRLRGTLTCIIKALVSIFSLSFHFTAVAYIYPWLSILDCLHSSPSKVSAAARTYSCRLIIKPETYLTDNQQSSS